MSDRETRALLAEALDLLNDHPRFSPRHDRRRDSYELAARIGRHLDSWRGAPHPAIMVGRERWAPSGVLRVDDDEHCVERADDGYWVRAWIKISFASVGEINQAFADRYQGAISALPDVTREVFIAHRRDGRSYREIAAQLGITLDGVERHITEALLSIDRAIRRG